MKKRKAIGPYSISVYLLKILSKYIALPLCDIINDSFSSGVFPDLMKLSKVIPLYKKAPLKTLQTTGQYHCYLFLVRLLKS